MTADSFGNLRLPIVPATGELPGKAKMAPPRLLITGASGYLGRRLTELAAKRGYEVVALGTTPSAVAARNFSWRLGDEPPSEAFEGVAALIHLAHSWASDTKHGRRPENINLSGTEMLARAAIAAGVPRFVFASTVSARPEALNAYGRIKYALEQRLLALPEASTRLLCARIGLVYGGPETGQYGLLSKLVRLTPALPMIGLDRLVQPIYLDEVCQGLLALALEPLPPPADGLNSRFVLAGPEPMAFGNWLRLLRRAHTGKGIVFIPLPMRAALAACDLTRILPFVPTINRERVLGLAGTAPMGSAHDLAALKVAIFSPEKRLASLPSERRRIIAESMAMLSYVAGRRLTTAAVARLVRGIDRQGGQSLGLPLLVLRCPALSRGLEPIRPRYTHRLAQRLHLAAMVVESMPDRDRPSRPRYISLVAQSLLEFAALPFRLMLGGLYS